MKKFSLLVIALSASLAPIVASAHGGGLDSNGGHNCYVGACAGTYHYHRSSPSFSSESDQRWGEVLDTLGVFLGVVFWVGLIIWIYVKVSNRRLRKRQTPRG